jgi:hypothetical protein
MINYKLAAMDAFAINKDWSEHVRYILRLEIIEECKK